MKKIASPTELHRELRALLAYNRTGTPSREKLAMSLQNMAERLSENPRLAAKGYNWQGEMLPLSKLIPQAAGKEIVRLFSGGLAYHLVMEGKVNGDATVFKISKKEWDRAKVKDLTTPKMKAEVLADEIKDLERKLSVRDAVDYNTWVKKENPSEEGKLDWLRASGGW